MSLSPGTRIGVYHIVGLIGAGGMGEVYRARDARLSRDVAIKVLPDLASDDPDRAARFEREARALATLSHPNIATIHGLEEVPHAEPGRSPMKALVMELVDGESLAERLAAGPVSEEDAVAMASQIADALAAAHEKGIIHRDLKPANVKLTASGTVKLLDFGLARMITDVSPDLSTLTLDQTSTGLIIGTPAYMPPEQAQGRPVDKRADVWAFGVMLYEMLAGAPLFRAESIQETFAAVLTTDPDWTRIPPRLQPILRRCLERDPRRRLRDLGDFRFLVQLASNTDLKSSSRFGRPQIAVGVLVFFTLVAFAAWGWLRPRGEDPNEPVRFTTMLPADVSVTRGPGYASSVAISPDGRTLLIAGTARDGQRLYRRALHQPDAAPLAGTENGSSPFFSWDGNWVGFFADGWLKRVPVAGGAAVNIVAVPAFPAGAGWGPDDQIVYAYGPNARLHSVSASGGTAHVLSEVESGCFPEILPGGQTLLYESDGWIYAFDRSTGRQTRLIEGSAPRFAMGQIILSRGNALLAAPLDLPRLAVAGPVVPLLEGLALERSSAGIPRHYTLSRNGTLAYVPAAERYELVLVNADGTERVVTDEHPMFQNPRFSSDGNRVVVAANRREGEQPDLWIHDLKSGSAGTRLTFGGGRAPVWSPGGTSITYSHLGERQGIYETRAERTGQPVQLVSLDSFHWLIGWTPDRRTLAYGAMEGDRSSIIARSGSDARQVVGPGNTWGGRLARDGRWLVYYLLESGNFEVYVTRFPEGGMRWLIAAGTDPTWSPDGNEIYYRSGSRLMAARVDKSAGVRVLSQRVVLEPFQPPLYDDYDIHPDGRTLVVVRPSGLTLTREVRVVLDWFTELRRMK